MPNNPKNRHRPGQNRTAAERLYELASEVADRLQREISSDGPERTLAELVERVLEEGDHRALEDAIERLGTADRQDAVDVLRYWVVRHASVLYTVLQTGSGAMDSLIMVFAMPILLGVPEGAAIPRSIPAVPDPTAPTTLNLLLASFRRHGLVAEEPGILVVPDLYAVQELPQDAFAWRQFLHRFEEVLRGHPESLPRHVPTPEEAIDPHGNGMRWILRYMLIAVVSSTDRPDPGSLLTGELELWTLGEEEADAAEWERALVMKQRVGAWHEEVVATLAEGWDGLFSITVGIPAPYDEALAAGETIRNIAQLMHTAEGLLEEGIPHLQASIGVFYGAGKTELRVALHGSSGSYHGAVWTCLDEVEQEIDTAQETLQRSGITAITVLPIPYSDERDPHTGEPIYPTRSGRLVRSGEPVAEGDGAGDETDPPESITYH